MNLTNIKHIDFFASIGGFHQAMSSFGAECLFALEWDKDCQDTYEANYGLSREQRGYIVHLVMLLHFQPTVVE